MKCDKKTMLLYAVTDRAWVGRQSLYEQVECALKGGATCVQVREKKLGDEDFLEEAKQIAALCKRYGVPLFINDNVDVAIACGAEGVHVGQEDMAAAKVREKVGRQSLYEQVECALKGGATCVQVREKKLGDEDFLEEAKQIAALCKRYGVPLFINDNVDVAIACGAEGVHVGQEDMAAAKVREKVGDNMMVGVSVHSVEEAKQAVRDGADCLGVGAMFSTSTKTDVDVLPKETLKAICDAVDIPVVAIGGLNKSNILELSGTGVDGVALVSAIFSAEDIESECRELRALSEKMVNA